MVQNTNKLVFSSMSDEKVNFSILHQDRYLEDILNKSVKIDSYSEKIEEIGLIYMAMDPTTHSFRPDRKFWRWKSGVFDMYVNVPDYEKYCQATEAEAKKIIAQLYLDSIKKYLWKRKDFDAKQFYSDVKEVFKPILEDELITI